MRRFKLKVCGLRDAANLAEVVELRPDYIGLIFVPDSPRYLGRSFDEGVISSISPEIKRVGVFRDEEISSIVQAAARYKLNAIQLHGTEGAAEIKALRSALPNTTIIKAVQVSGPESFSALMSMEHRPDLYLFDNGRGGTGESFDWRILREYRGDIPFLLAGGIGLHSIDEVVGYGLTVPLMAGIDINSQVELAPGVKNIQLIKAILSRLES